MKQSPGRGRLSVLQVLSLLGLTRLVESASQ